MGKVLEGGGRRGMEAPPSEVEVWGPIMFFVYRKGRVGMLVYTCNPRRLRQEDYPGIQASWTT